MRSQGSPTHEIHLPPYPAILQGANRLGTHLPGQIHLQGAIDGHKMVELASDVRVVGVGNRVHLDYGSIIRKVKQATILPRSRVLRAPVITPRSTRSITPSENISVWMPRSRRSVSVCSAASGMAPMPSCNVAPSSISSPTFRPITRCVSSGGSPFTS